MSSDDSKVAKISQIGEMLEKSCLDLVKMRHDYDEISTKVLKRTKEHVVMLQKVEDKCIKKKMEYINKTSEEVVIEEEIQQLEEEITSLIRKRREVGIEVLVLRAQKDSLRTYLVGLKKRVAEKRRTDKKMRLKLKEDARKEEEISDIFEVVDHNRSQLIKEHALLRKVLTLAVDEYKKMKEWDSNMDDQISQSGATAMEMREEFYKVKMEEDLLAIETTNIWLNIEDIPEEDFNVDETVAADPKLERAKIRLEEEIAEKKKKLERIQKLLAVANRTLEELIALEPRDGRDDGTADDKEIEKLEKEIEELERRGFSGLTTKTVPGIEKDFEATKSKQDPKN